MNKFYEVLIRPKSNKEDISRREFVLNVLLTGTIVFSVIAFLRLLFESVYYKPNYTGAPPLLILLPILIFGFLLFLSRLKLYKLAGSLFVIIFFILGTYPLYVWGILLPQGLLIYALVIITSGIIISTRFSAAMTLVASAALIALVFLQSRGINAPDITWSSDYGKYTDVVVFSFTLGIITLVSWLYNREMEKSLTRAKNSEAALKQERDNLEIKVEERTRELKQAQLEKVKNLYRFAELGRLSAELFHDLVNSLTAVSINLDQLKTKSGSDLVKRSIKNIRHIEELAKSARRQIQAQSEQRIFSADNEIRQVISLLISTAKKKKVTVTFSVKGDYFKIFGSPIKFHQMVMNIISNAVDSYEGLPAKTSKLVKVVAADDHDNLVVTVHDRGKGISKKDIGHIFEAFYTTKKSEEGTGIGLFIAKNIVEKEFGGTIKVESKPSFETLFTITVPLKLK